MAWIQGKAGLDPGSGTSCSVTLTNPVGSGNTVVGFVVTASAVSSATVTDDKSNSYNVVIEAGEFVLFYLTAITNGPSTITVNFGATISHPEAIVDEYSGISSITGTSYQTVSGPGTGSDGISSGNVTTSEADVVWGAVANYGGYFPVAGTGFTQRSTSSPTGDGLVSEDLTQGSAGSVAATFTAPSGGGGSQYYCGMITMKPGSTIFTASLSESANAIDNFAALLQKLSQPYAVFQPLDLLHAMQWRQATQDAIIAAIRAGDPNNELPQLQQQLQAWTSMVAALQRRSGVTAEATKQGLTFAAPIWPNSGET